MVHSCVVRGCSNSYGMKKTLKLHRFPKDAHTRKLWKQAINRDDEIKNHWRICNEHFLISDYDSDSKLKNGSVPTVFTIKKCVECNPNGQNLNFQKLNEFSSKKNLCIAQTLDLNNLNHEKNSVTPSAPKNKIIKDFVPENQIVTTLDNFTVISSNNQHNDLHEQNKDENIKESSILCLSDGTLLDVSQLSNNEYEENEVQIIDDSTSSIEFVSDITLQDDSNILLCDQQLENVDIDEFVEVVLQNGCITCDTNQENEIRDQNKKEFAVDDLSVNLLDEDSLACALNQQNELQCISGPHVMPTCTSLGTQTTPKDDDKESLEKLKLNRKIRSLQRTLNRRNKKLSTYRQNKELQTRFDKLNNLLKYFRGKSFDSDNVLQLVQSLTKKISNRYR